MIHTHQVMAENHRALRPHEQQQQQQHHHHHHHAAAIPPPLRLRFRRTSVMPIPRSPSSMQWLEGV